MRLCLANIANIAEPAFCRITVDLCPSAECCIPKYSLLKAINQVGGGERTLGQLAFNPLLDVCLLLICCYCYVTAHSAYSRVSSLP